MRLTNQKLFDMLIQKGVRIDSPESVWIEPDVNPERISGDGVVIHAGCRISGQSTLILQGGVIGREGPVTIESCQIGPHVHLKSGFFKDAVFLEGSSLGSGTHVREGTILEEYASTAHAVGLKQTILFPFVTLGSLINFCDCLMAGGTSRQDHSEVGSSFIHFNYTPNQDKATASLIGDVPRGVMLNQRPIFLGGQGGLVGPCRLEFGTITTAGTVCRKDQLKPDLMVFERGGARSSIPYQPGLYQSIKRIVANNLIYLANLAALKQWYRYVRSEFISDRFPKTLLEGLQEKLEMAIEERIVRLDGFRQKMPESIRIYKKTAGENTSELIKQKNEFYTGFEQLKEVFENVKNHEGDDPLRDRFLERIVNGIQISGKDYIGVIKSLKTEESEIGIRWLQGIVDQVIENALGVIPSFGAVGRKGFE